MEYINNQIYKNYIKKQKGGKFETAKSLIYLAGLPERIEKEEKNLEIIFKDHSSLTESQLKTLRDQVIKFWKDTEIFSKDVSEFKRSVEVDDDFLKSEIRNDLEQIDGIRFGSVEDGKIVKINLPSIDLSIYLERIKKEIDKFSLNLENKLSFSIFGENLSEDKKNNEKLSRLKSILEAKLDEIKSIKIPNNMILLPELIDIGNFKSSITRNKIILDNINNLEARSYFLLLDDKIARLTRQISEKQVELVELKALKPGPGNNMFKLITKQNLLNSDIAVLNEELEKSKLEKSKISFNQQEDIDEKLIDTEFKKFSEDLIDSGDILLNFNFQKEILKDINKMDKFLLLIKPTEFKNQIQFIPQHLLDLLNAGIDFPSNIPINNFPASSLK